MFPGGAADPANLTMLQSWGEFGLSCVVWGAAEVLADHLRQAYGYDGETPTMHGLNVLELGAGPGLSGLTAARLGAQRVVLTDRESVLECTRQNADVNRGNKTAGTSSRSSASATLPTGAEVSHLRAIDVRPLDWGLPADRVRLEAEYGAGTWDLCKSKQRPLSFFFP